MFDLLNILIMVLLVVSVSVAVLVVLARGWVGRTGTVPDLLAQAVRTDLLEYIKDAATEPNMRVYLRRFWRGKKWTRRQRYVLVSDLIDRQILRLPLSDDDPLTRFLQQAMYHALFQPPSAVVLNTRDWTRMATDSTGVVPSIIVGRISGGVNQIGGTNNRLSQHGAATDATSRLIDALREDAPTIPPEVARQALVAADGLEQCVRESRWDEVAAWLTTVSSLTSSSEAIMRATKAALDLFH